MWLHAIARTIVNQPDLLVTFYGLLVLFLLFSGVRKSVETRSWRPFYVWTGVLLVPAFGVLILAALAHIIPS